MSKGKNNSTSSSKFIFWVIGLAAVVLIAIIFLGNQPDSTKNSKPAVKKMISYAQQPIVGKSSAPVSIIEFGDYKCPNCKNFNEKVIPIIKQELVDNGKAKLYFINDAFIYDDSVRSAKFAESVYEELGNSMFWKYHDLLYQKQPEDPKYEKMDFFNETVLTDTLKEIAGQEEVDKVVANFHAKKSDPAFKKDMGLADQLGVTGTPTLFVNGKLFDGKTIDDLVQMVDQAVKGKKNE
jgi:protein-disulfide isomerase